MNHELHRTWLKVTAFVIGSFGPVFSLGSVRATSEPARLTLDLLGWPLDGSSTFESPDTRFLAALTGGFLMGWGVMVYAMAKWVHPHAPEAVRRAVLAGVGAWFVTDSCGSIASGNASNALFNVLVLALAVGPLAWPASSEAARSGGAQP